MLVIKNSWIKGSSLITSRNYCDLPTARLDTAIQGFAVRCRKLYGVPRCHPDEGGELFRGKTL
jgi:hypothetical protein